MNRAPLSILIPAKNEGHQIAACLESCAFADEIVVVDSSSTDSTADLAAKAGAKVVNFQWNGREPKKKNWALANIPWRHEWVFILDADERITPALADELSALLRSGPGKAGFYVNRKFWFLDGWLMHCGYYPSWNLRFFRHRLGRYESLGIDDTHSGDNEVHEHVILQGEAGHLRGELEHFAFPNIETWVEKHNRYSNWEARLSADSGPVENRIDPSLARKRALKRLGTRLPFRPAQRFIYHYFLRAGFLDGYRGYVFCRLMAYYEFLSVAKARELSRTSGH